MSNADALRLRPKSAAGQPATEHCVLAWMPAGDCSGSELSGWIGLAASARGIRRLGLPVPSLGTARQTASDGQTCAPIWTPLLCRAYWQLRAYLAGKPAPLTVPIDLSHATAFQQAVLGQARAIPPGSTRSYGQLAAAVGRPRAARAVGRVMATNPIPLVVPCHRVVGADGSLTGFGGGLAQKRALLHLEQVGREGSGCPEIGSGGHRDGMKCVRTPVKSS
jgi:methylated-DNA-[protein]-cysteine S-methyltransferase